MMEWSPLFKCAQWVTEDKFWSDVGREGGFVCLYLTDVRTYCAERTVVPPWIEYLKGKVGFVKSTAQCS